MTADTGSLIVKVTASIDGFVTALERATASMEAFAAALVDGIEQAVASMTSAGALVYRAAIWLGFSPVAVIAWLETCPGAFQRDFGDGWECK